METTVRGILFWLWLFKEYRQRRAKKQGIPETKTDRVAKKAYEVMRIIQRTEELVYFFSTLQVLFYLLIFAGVAWLLYLAFLQIIKVFGS